MSADIAAAIAAYRATGSKAAAARLLGIPVTTLKDRIAAGERNVAGASAGVKGRAAITVENGTVIVFSDAHYWPGERSAGHRGLLHLIRYCASAGYVAKAGPLCAIVCNGDAIDGSSISRHPPIGWEGCPSVAEELKVCQERLGEIGEALSDAGIAVAVDLHAADTNTHLIWNLGNHDARFETRLAQVAPEFRDVHGIHLKDHFPDWEPAWSTFINDNVVIKHRMKGGQHAPYNNTIHAGRSIITGHLHSAKVTPFSDYNGIRYGVDTGCLADTYHPAFQGYLEDNTRDWRSGFCVLTFKDGKLLMPELVLVWDEETIQFRGELIRV